MSFITLCQIDDIPDESCKGFNPVNNRSFEAAVFGVKKDGELHLYRNYCPHLGLPLEWMPDQFLDREGQHIQCATHGALFRIQDGLCISGPCPGESLQAIPFRMEGKSVMINVKDIKTDNIDPTSNSSTRS